MVDEKQEEFEARLGGVTQVALLVADRLQKFIRANDHRQPHTYNSFNLELFFEEIVSKLQCTRADGLEPDIDEAELLLHMVVEAAEAAIEEAKRALETLKGARS